MYTHQDGLPSIIHARVLSVLVRRMLYNTASMLFATFITMYNLELRLLTILITLLPTATLSKLEALCVSNEGVIGNLHSQISGLQQKVGQLEGEREALQSSQRTSGEQLSTRIRVLEKVRVWGGGRVGGVQ